MPPRKRPEDGTEVPAIIEKCRAAGLRVTRQRRAIYRVLISTTSHPTAEDIHRKLSAKIPGLSLDTIYRTLLLMETHGLIRRVEVLDDRARFDARLDPHHHLVCKVCRQVTDCSGSSGEGDPSTIPPEAKGWGRVESRHVEFRGICKDCLERRRFPDQ